MINYTILLFDKSDTLENKIITKDYIFNNIVIDMQERDLHIIDPTNKSNISVLLIKKYCILIKLDYLRCILTPNKVYIFSISDSRCRKFLEFLRKHYAENKGSENPFEFIILEAMLIEICNLLEENVASISKQVNHFLVKISESVNNYKLSVPIQIELLKKEFQIKEIKDLITEVLQSDEDMSNMYLTRNATISESNKIDKSNHVELEVLIENYEKLVDEINDKLKRMIREIDISQKIANLSLATTRNDIAILNTKISIISISLSSGSLVASIFGMNLYNSYENNNIAFIVVSSIIVGLFITSMTVSRYICKIKF